MHDQVKNAGLEEQLGSAWTSFKFWSSLAPWRVSGEMSFSTCLASIHKPLTSGLYLGMLEGHHETMQAVSNMSDEITKAQAQVKFTGR